MKDTTSPTRSGNKAVFVFWMVLGTLATFWGMLQMVQAGGNKFFGLICAVGFPLMCAREWMLRRRWLKDNPKK
jgi:hypothetical protein